ncbi:MAG TPA: hypothetical protein VMA36_05545 [Candidatus Limnocylindria bacterium]|nr:hypothetical protein [Candidatus Limnocylindria bacterium]
MNRRLPLLALTGLAAGASIFGLMQKPADADGFSITVGGPGYAVHYDDWRYRHDYAYREWWWRHERYERYERWREAEWRHEHWRREHWREARWRREHDDDDWR